LFPCFLKGGLICIREEYSNKDNKKIDKLIVNSRYQVIVKSLPLFAAAMINANVL
jgi:hypothetical protein